MGFGLSPEQQLVVDTVREALNKSILDLSEHAK